MSDHLLRLEAEHKRRRREFYIILAVINMIPIPPADGGRVVVGLLPDAQAQSYARIEKYGMFILIAILILNPFNVLNWTIRPLIEFMLGLLLF